MHSDPVLASADLVHLPWTRVGFVNLDGATVALGDPARIATARDPAMRDDFGVGNAVAWLRTGEDGEYPVESVAGPHDLRAVRVELTTDLARLEADGEGTWQAIGSVELPGPWLAAMDPFGRRYDTELARLPATAKSTRWFGEPVPVGCAFPWPAGIHGVQIFRWATDILGIRLTLFPRDDADEACPRCRGPLQQIGYGMPSGPPEPGVILGGCCVDPGLPLWICPWCDERVGELEPTWP